MNLRNWKISDAIFLAGIPIIANIVLFVYFAGYLSNFNIPVTLIYFDLADLFILSTILLFLCATGFFYYALISTSIKSSVPSWIVNRILRSVVLYLLIGIIANVLDKKFSITSQSIIIGFIVLIEFISPLFTEKDESNYKLKLISQDQKINNATSPFLIFIRFWQSILLWISLLIVILMLIYQVGQITAATQNNYYVINDTQEMAVLYLRNDFFIIAPFDRNEKTIDDSFQILNIGDTKGVSISYEQVGPLVLKSKRLNSTNIIPPLITPPSITQTPSPTPNSYP